MIKFYNEESIKEIWDSNILNLSNPTFYQSYNFSQICKDGKKVVYVCDRDNYDDIKIMCFAKIYDDRISIPFGPVFKSDITINEILDFVDNIRKLYNKSVVFSLPPEFINEKILLNSNLEIGWHFVTPLVSTENSIEKIVKNCNENRRRIIKRVLNNIPQSDMKMGLKYADDFIKLYEKRMKETNGEIDLSINYLNKLLEYDNIKLTVCLNNDKLIAGSVTFEYGDTLITRYNCFDSDFSKLSPIARIDYELLKYASESSEIKYFDMSGLAVDENITEKEYNLNRYKLSYRPQKELSYQFVKYK